MTSLEHIGIAVADPEAVARLYASLLGVRPYKRERVEREGVQTHFLSAGTAKLELLEALGPDSPVARHLEKRGEGLHHLAFEVDDIYTHLQRMRELGFTPLSDEPRPGADGKLIFFLHPRQTHGVLVEFCQSTPTPLSPSPIPYRDGYLSSSEHGDRGNPALAVLYGTAGATTRDVEPLVRHLEPYFHVLTLDLDAQHLPDAFDVAPSRDEYADRVRALLDGYGVQEAHLFGLSAGGLAALCFALDHPQRARRLAVHGVPVDSLAAFEEAAGALAHRAHAVLVSTVDRDGRFPLDALLALHNRLPDSTLAVLPGTRLAPARRDAALYARLLLRHFTEAESD